MQRALCKLSPLILVKTLQIGLFLLPRYRDGAKRWPPQSGTAGDGRTSVRRLAPLRPARPSSLAQNCCPALPILQPNRSFLPQEALLVVPSAGPLHTALLQSLTGPRSRASPPPCRNLAACPSVLAISCLWDPIPPPGQWDRPSRCSQKEGWGSDGESGAGIRVQVHHRFVSLVGKSLPISMPLFPHLSLKPCAFRQRVG